MRGLFITFEGPEGSGKSTQIRRLAAALRKRGIRPVMTREPGGTPLGERIRQLLLRGKRDDIDPRSELFLYLAARADHVRRVIVPALKMGRIVLCDRFSDSTRVYQGKGRGLSGSFVGHAVAYSERPVRPDLTLLLDLDVTKGLTRVRKRGRANRFDRENRLFHQRVRKGFLVLAKKEPRRIRRIDAGLDRDTIEKQIWNHVRRKLAAKGMRRKILGE